MGNVTGGQLAAEALIERGVEYVFTLSGGHITPIYQHLEESAVTLFDTRHEQAATFMAEAWGKLTRTLGIAMVTAGPGFTNALTGVASAYFSNTPMVIIAGCVGLEHKEKLDLQDMDQEPVIRPMVKKTLVCQKTERVPEFFDLAFRYATSGRPGPVLIDLTKDAQFGKLDFEYKKCTKIRSYVPEMHVDPHQVKAAADLIDAPVITNVVDIDVDGDGIPYRTLPGEDPKGAYFTRGSGHNKKGAYTEDSNEYQEVIDRLLVKWDTAKTLVPDAVLSQSAHDTKLGVLAYGSSDGAFIKSYRSIGYWPVSSLLFAGICPRLPTKKIATAVPVRAAGA